MNEDDDKTRVLPAGAAAAMLGGASAPSGDRPSPAMLEAGANALPAGTLLHEYRIVSTIGEGGFGIVYLADDLQLDDRVAIKEYMPGALASRGSGLNVTVRSARHQETFEAGRRSFVKEAKALRHFDHPSLAKVYRFWEANGTAYMVMPFYEGVTLKEMLRARGVPDEAWLRGFLRQLLEALAVVHREDWYHRDIAPDNILMLAGDRPLLLDFGAARRVIGDMTQALTVILKPGFAPLEQYAEIPGVRQGPWTDLYALAAVVHYAIVGKAPVPSVSRMVTDSLEPLARVAAGRYGDAFLRAIDHALAVRPEARTQSVEQFAQELGLPSLITVPLGRFDAEPKQPVDMAPGRAALDTTPSAERSASRPTAETGASGRAGSGAHVAPAGQAATAEPPGPPTDAARKGAATSGRRAGAPTIALGGLAALALAAGGWWLYAGRGAGPDKPPAKPTGEPVVMAPDAGKATPPPEAPKPMVAKPMPDPAVEPASPEAGHAASSDPAGAASSAPSASASIPASAPTAPASVPTRPSPDHAPSAAPSPSRTDALGPIRLLDALHDGADGARRIVVRAERSTVRIGKDALRFRIRSELDGYLYVFMVGTDGTTVSQLFPNALDSNNRIAQGSDLVLPRRGWTMTAGGPPGVDRFVAIVSAAPRDFAPAGLHPGNPFAEFDLDAARRAMAAGGAVALAGRPDCAEQRLGAVLGIENGSASRSAQSGGKADCGAYAAARFEITETRP